MPILNVSVKPDCTAGRAGATVTIGGRWAWDGTWPNSADKPEGVLDPIAARTPIGRLVTMRELSEAALFLLENGSVNRVNLAPTAAGR
jgi:hypothetical protein